MRKVYQVYKANLIQFIVDESEKKKYRDILQCKSKVMYVTCEKKCWKITAAAVEDIKALSSCHEEADERMLLHADHASKEDYQAVVINSEDTNVFLLCLAYNQQIQASLFQKCGKQIHTRLIDIGKAASSLGGDICKSIVGLQAYTGCDTVSAFPWKRQTECTKNPQGSQGIQRNFFSQIGTGL